MNFHLVEHLHKLWIAMIHDFAMAKVEFCDFRHILIAERKIPYGQILFHALLVDRFGNNGYTALYVPAQSYLGGAFAKIRRAWTVDSPRSGKKPRQSRISITW